MKDLLKKKWKLIGGLLFFPLVFIVILKICVRVLPGEMIGTIDGWLGFLGGYFGVLGAILAVYLQLSEEKTAEIQGLLLYIKNILKDNCKNYTPTYISQLDNEAKSIIWLPNYQEVEIKLKSFDLSKEDILLLYKHRFDSLVELNSKINSTLKGYTLNNDEEFIFNELESFLKKLKTLPEFNQEFLKEIEKIFYLEVVFSEYFYYYPRKKVELQDINERLKSFNVGLISQKIFNINTYSDDIDKHHKKLITFFEVIQEIDYNIVAEKYCLGLHLLTMMVRIYNVDLGKRLTNVIAKKIYLFSNRNMELHKKMSLELEKLTKILK